MNEQNKNMEDIQVNLGFDKGHYEQVANTPGCEAIAAAYSLFMYEVGKYNERLRGNRGIDPMLVGSECKYEGKAVKGEVRHAETVSLSNGEIVRIWLFENDNRVLGIIR